MKRTTKKFACIMMTLAVVMSCAFVYAPAEAATVPAPGQVMSIKAIGISTYEATISWGKASGKVDGYTIYRNGKAIKMVSANIRLYKSVNLKASTNYTYYVRAYRLTGEKVKQWYNKKTKKWQSTIPANSIRGDSRIVSVKKYGKASPTLSIKTQKAVVIQGEEMHPSQFKKDKNGKLVYSFTKKGTACKTCKVGKTVKVAYDPKQGVYSYSITGRDNSKTCHNAKCKKNTP